METNHFQSSILNPQLIQVAIVDDHKVVVDGIKRIIDESGIGVVTGMAYSVAGCLKLLEREQPAVLLLDIGLPDGNGTELCVRIRRLYPEVKILMLTSYAELTVINETLDNGALGYVLKNSTTEEIIEGIVTVANGQRFLCTEVDLLLKQKDENSISLSRRERELLRFIAAGHPMNVIADKMFIGYETVRSYRKNIMTKLKVPNTASLIKLAMEHKLV
jgi:DNA-binding NarL/FixJ family response regulator